MTPRRSYSELLRHPKWQRKRLEVMNRDGFRCTECGDEESELHVHHKTYIAGKDPWDYPLENFSTLCHRCHELKKVNLKTLQTRLLEELAKLGLPADLDKLTASLLVKSSKPFIQKVVRFIETFWAVFDNDWEFTTCRLGIMDENYYIEEGATFLHPGVVDESNNWANRGAILAAYRDLLTAMRQFGLPSEPPFFEAQALDEDDLVALVAEGELNQRNERLADLSGGEWESEGRF